jgi:hypothetical protein
MDMDNDMTLLVRTETLTWTLKFNYSDLVYRILVKSLIRYTT